MFLSPFFDYDYDWEWKCGRLLTWLFCLRWQWQEYFQWCHSRRHLLRGPGRDGWPCQTQGPITEWCDPEGKMGQCGRGRGNKRIFEKEEGRGCERVPLSMRLVNESQGTQQCHTLWRCDLLAWKHTWPSRYPTLEPIWLGEGNEERRNKKCELACHSQRRAMEDEIRWVGLLTVVSSDAENIRS